MLRRVCFHVGSVMLGLSILGFCSAGAESLTRVQYNHPGLKVDLGVGLWAWPLPMDWDEDGDLDLVVSCPDVPFNGTYVFENPGGDTAMPVFKPPVRVGKAMRNVQVSYVAGRPRVLTPGQEWTGFLGRGFQQCQTIPLQFKAQGKVRANQWRYMDYDADGVLDLVVGVGSWTDYGWDNAFDRQGRWTRGPLHGYVYWFRNTGSTDRPQYAEHQQLMAAGRPVDVYGMPSPNLADFDGDGDLDLLCGEFLDGFSYFQNLGTRAQARFAGSVRLSHKGQPLTMDLQMITPTAVDWDGDGDMDLIVGDEDGRVALVEHTGRIENGVPQFLPPQYFQQEARDLKFGALVTPVSVDWDGDGDEDLVCGNTAGHLGFFENLDGGNPPKWAQVRLLQADGQSIRIQAGPTGSIQGPCEAKWGYSTLSVADWDHDGLLDLVVNSIWGKVVWYRNQGSRGQPRLRPARPIEVQWQDKAPKPAWNWWDAEGQVLATQWRTTPVVVDWDEDGLNDLLMLDHEGYLALFKRERAHGQLRLLPGVRMFQGSVFDSSGKELTKQVQALRLNAGIAGKSGRRKFCVLDWDGDGLRDLMVNSRSINLLLQERQDDVLRFTDMGPVTKHRLAGHTTSPTSVDWDGDGIRDLLIGAEDGRFYYMPNPRAQGERATRTPDQE
jgi:hypothetical protein